MQVDAAFVGSPRTFVQAIYPGQGCPAALVIHGAGAYSGLYMPFAYELAMRGLGAVLVDLPGHGLSDGWPGHIDRYEDYFPALEHALDWCARALRPTAVYLVGESYGAVLAFHMAFRKPVHGVVLSAPSFRPRITPEQRRLVLMLGRWLPFCRLPAGPDQRASRHPIAGEVVRRNPLIHRWLTARYVLELLRAGEDAICLARSFYVAALFLISADDQIVDNLTNSEVFRSIPSIEKHWVLNHAGPHALLVDYPEWCATQIKLFALKSD